MRVSVKLIAGLVSAVLTGAAVSCGDDRSVTSAGSASCGTKEITVQKKCSKNWELLMIKSATEGTDKISDSSAQCTSQQLADSDARVILVGDIDRAYDEDPTAVPFFEAVKPLIAAMEKCLKPHELAGLDWT